MNRKVVAFIAVISLFAVSLSCGGGKNTKSNSSSSSEQSSMRGQADGYAKIFDDDEALALDRALDDAKNNLVKKKLGEDVSGSSTMANYRLVENIVKTKSFGLVRDVRVVKKWKDSGVMFVTIEGTVEPKAVSEAIADILDTYGRPKFMVLVKETFEGTRNEPGFTETEIVMQDIMGTQGFEFVDPMMTQQLMKQQAASMSKAMNGRIDDSVKQVLLNSAGAEVIILGQASTSDQTAVLQQYGSQNMKSKRVNLQLKAIDVYTGRIIATKSLRAAGLDIDPESASRKAISQALRSSNGLGSREKTGAFMEAIVHQFVKSATQRTITLSIGGLDYENLRKFQNQVEHRIRGVQKVVSRGQAGRFANVDVYFAGKTNDFADELRAKSENMGFKVRVSESYPNRLVLVVEPR